MIWFLWVTGKIGFVSHILILVVAGCRVERDLGALPLVCVACSRERVRRGRGQVAGKRRVVCGVKPVEPREVGSSGEMPAGAGFSGMRRCVVSYARSR